MTTFSPGDKVKVQYETDGGHLAWYRAAVVRPSTQRAGDYEVRVTEVGSNSTVTVGALLSPILGLGVDMLPDD